MEKVRVRYVVKSGKMDPAAHFDDAYEVDHSKREVVSNILEKKLDDSLKELEMALKKTSSKLDA